MPRLTTMPRSFDEAVAMLGHYEERALPDVRVGGVNHRVYLTWDPEMNPTTLSVRIFGLTAVPDAFANSAHPRTWPHVMRFMRATSSNTQNVVVFDHLDQGLNSALRIVMRRCCPYGFRLRFGNTGRVYLRQAELDRDREIEVYRGYATYERRNLDAFALGA